MASLVIVESPAKAKTIGKYLGKDFTVKASMGHLRDLPKSTMGIDIDGGFTPEYRPISGKEEMIDDLRKAAGKASRVYLATDPDREGEAISWHLKELLNLSDENALRVTFNEITKKVVAESIENPRKIDENLVDAQQARRVIDRIVGYQLSPLLWKKIRRGLSAGRVQSVATRIVVDRENEIRAFVPEEYWTIEADLSRVAPMLGSFKAKFHGNVEKSLELTSEAEAGAVASAVSQSPFSVHEIKRTDRKKSPSPPFITSSLQQEASRRLGMMPRRTMSVAQQLYEGIELQGQGLTGLITYMRTDSLRLSDEAVFSARDFIKARYGSQYLPKEPRRFKTRGGAQDAHEAIRPTDVRLDPESLRGILNNDQHRLYRLIWRRFVACQMESAVYDTLTIDAVSAGYLFRANRSSLKFSGFTAVYDESADDDAADSAPPLPNLSKGEPLSLVSLQSDQHFTQPPPRYNEATLIRAMEENGIGRPSTYAPTISTILDREYVVKEGKALRPTPLGEVVNGLMMDKFNDIVDIAFTARLEENLDKIEEGKKNWKIALSEFYSSFSVEMRKAEQELSNERIRVPDEVSNMPCDQCGAMMVIKSGRFGRFLACPNYPECKNTKPIMEEMPGHCPSCGAKIYKKKSKNGYTYYGCEHNPACGFMTWDIPTVENCGLCGKTMFKRSGRGSKKSYCTNPECPDFLPEDQRGYKKKKAENASVDKDDSEKTAAKKPTAKKTAKASASSKMKAAPKSGTAAKAKTAPKSKTASKTGSKSKTAPKTSARARAAK